MWIVYLLAGIIAIPVVTFASLILYIWLRTRNEINSAKNTDYSQADPLLDNLNPHQPALLYFTADWCTPCKTMQTPAIEALQQNMPELQVVTVNIEQQPDVAKRWSVMSVPRTVVVGKNRQVRDVNFGVTATALLKQQFEDALKDMYDSVRVHTPEKESSSIPKFKFNPGKPTN